MSSAISRRRCLRALICLGCGASATASAGCGSIFYPERIGQPAGALDWRVVAMDGAGLLLFFIPGLVAFAVDFYNGTIFLPSTQYSVLRPETADELAAPDVSPQESLEQVPIEQVPIEQAVTERGTIDQEAIERTVSRHLGRPISLASGQYHTRPLRSLKDFWPQTWRLRAQLDA